MDESTMPKFQIWKGKSVKIIIQFFIGVVILLWILKMSDQSRVIGIIMSLNFLNLVYASAMFIIASFMVALALYWVLRGSQMKLSLRNTSLASFAGQLLSDLTPARTGYFATPFILNRIDGTSIESGMIGVATTGIVNFAVKAVLCIVALAYFGWLLPLDEAMVASVIFGALALLAGAIVLALIVWEKRFEKRLQELKKFPLIGGFLSKIASKLINTQEKAQKSRKQLKQVTFFIIASVIANGAANYIISTTIFVNTPTLLDFILMVPLMSALMYIPVTIAGLGTQEGGYVILLMLMGQPMDKAVAFALVSRLLFTGTDIIGIHPLIKAGISLTKAGKSNDL